MSASVRSDPAVCDLRFGQVGLACVRVHELDPAALQAELARRTTTAPALFDQAAVVLDLSHLAELPADTDVTSLLDAIRAAGMLPVGIAYGEDRNNKLAARLGLPVIAKFRAAFERGAGPSTPTANPSPAPAPAKRRAAAKPAVDPEPAPASAFAMQHNQGVHSGQQIYAAGRDLVITATVSNGAEVIADGSIHIYGSLRGRALAGAQGDTNARIYCAQFQPELVSIAGRYRVFEELPRQWAGKAVCCRLEGDKLVIDKL